MRVAHSVDGVDGRIGARFGVVAAIDLVVASESSWERRTRVEREGEVRERKSSGAKLRQEKLNRGDVSDELEQRSVFGPEKRGVMKFTCISTVPLPRSRLWTHATGRLERATDFPVVSMAK